MRHHLAHERGQRFAFECCELHETRAFGARVRFANARDIDLQLQRKMREDVAHIARQPAPFQLRAARESRGALRDRNPRSIPSSALRSCRRAGRAAGGRRSIVPSARSTTKAAPRRNSPSAFGVRRGNVSWSPRRRASQRSFHGQSKQAGRFGVQIVAPRSIIAWAKSPARRAGASSAASRCNSGFAAGSGVSTA